MLSISQTAMPTSLATDRIDEFESGNTASDTCKNKGGYQVAKPVKPLLCKQSFT